MLQMFLMLKSQSASVTGEDLRSSWLLDSQLGLSLSSTCFTSVMQLWSFAGVTVPTVKHQQPSHSYDTMNHWTQEDISISISWWFMRKIWHLFSRRDTEAKTPTVVRDDQWTEWLTEGTNQRNIWGSDVGGGSTGGGWTCGASAKALGSWEIWLSLWQRWCFLHSPRTGTSPGTPALHGQSRWWSLSLCKTRAKGPKSPLQHVGRRLLEWKLNFFSFFTHLLASTSTARMKHDQLSFSEEAQLHPSDCTENSAVVLEVGLGHCLRV